MWDIRVIWLRKFYLKNSRGSVTVEASIVFPLFLCVFFLLLFLVKFVCTGILLDYAVNETAKEIAAAAYPISFLNELEDEKLQKYETAEIPDTGGESEGGFDYISTLISGNMKEERIDSLIKGAIEDYEKGIIGYLGNSITPAYWKLKTAAKYSTVQTMLRKHLDDSIIDADRLKLSLVEFPQSEAEYEKSIGSGIYRNSGLTPEQDFVRDDVVIQLEYDYAVTLPFMKELNIKMVHTAVEKAWLSGSCGIITEKQEGLDLSSDGTIVYVTRTGIRYHLGSCRHLHSSKIPIEINEAKAEGYTPCKVCRPPN